MNLKKGDIVVCIPGMSTSDSATNKGGSGYKDGKIFIIDRITENHNNNEKIAWLDGSGQGIWTTALRHASEYEAKWFSTLKGPYDNISEIWKSDIKKYSVHYINLIGEKVVADVEDMKEIPDMKEFLYKFER